MNFITSVLNKFLEPKFIVSLGLLGIAGICVLQFPESNAHMILGTNIITGVGGYWIGTSFSSASKDNAIFKIGGLNDEKKTEVIDSIPTSNIPG